MRFPLFVVLLWLDVGLGQLFSIDDTLRLIQKQQNRFGVRRKEESEPGNEERKPDLFVRMNDFASSDLQDWERVYNVIVIPPPAQSGVEDPKHEQRFLNTGISQIHFSLLCSEGIPLLREDDQPKRCNPNSQKTEDSCPSKFWCHIGNTAATFFCCPSNRKIPNLCHLPPNSGFGTDKINRFWYDWRSGFCRDMIYTGFGGNENNFISRQLCEKRCSGTPKPSSLDSAGTVSVKTKQDKLEPLITTSRAPELPKRPTSTSTARPSSTTTQPKPKMFTSTTLFPSTTTTSAGKSSNPCNLSPDRGAAGDVAPSSKWYFDLATDRCVQFQYLGSAGNENNFADERACLDTCAGGSREAASCLAPMEVGIGPFSITRYYYNVQAKACRKFTYRGTGGNANRFTTRSTCENLCVKGLSPMHSRKSMPRASTSAPSTTTKPSPTVDNPSVPSNFHGNPYGLNPETLQNILDLKKFPLPPDPFALPDVIGVTTTALPSPVETETVSPEKVLISNIFERRTESELTEDPFAMPSTTSSPETDDEDVAPLFPLTHPPDESDLNAVTQSQEYNPLVDALTIVGLPSTTPSAVEWPTLVSLVDGSNANSQSGFPGSPQGFPHPSTLDSAFSKHFGRRPSPPSTATSNIVDSRPTTSVNSITSASTNTVHLTSNGVAKPNGPIVVSACRVSRKGSLIQNCRPDGAVGAVWGHVCPNGTFCQIGETVAQSTCCPKLEVNPCLQSKTSGIGTATLRRWYFDALTKTCKGFIFKGFQGNQNSFLSFETCRRTCQSKNPCPYGQPYGFEMVDGAASCSPDRASCPAKHYCHVDGPNTFCCPLFNGNITVLPPPPFTNNSLFGSPLVGQLQAHARKHLSPCAMPISAGNGDMTLHRWAYNPAQKTCVTFVYKGEGGNQNNFLTRRDCLNSCLPVANPCGSGKPFLDGTHYRRCKTSRQCPAGHYCHHGSSADTSVCCSGASVDRCLLSLATGTGSSTLHRYYFDSATSTCKAFTYTGLGGNENNFDTVQECRKACPEYDNPCAHGKPHTHNADGRVSFCSASNTNCPKNHFCHIGESRQTTVCCPTVGPSLPCAAPVNYGTGKAQLPRYFYNDKTRSCVSFIYTGKGGNANNFVSKTECEVTCPVLDNPCVAGFPALDRYGEPMFCSTADSNSCPRGYWCHIGSTQATTICCPGMSDPCRMPMSKGIGHSVLNRWYYNSESRVCVSFVYTGRGGNQNNFISRAQCLDACPEYTSPCPDGQPHIGLSGQITHCGATDPSICPTTYWCHIGATLETSVCCPGAADPCDQEVDAGSGSNQILRYYYHQLTRTCKQFRYTGIGGNENNFLTRAACEARCPVFVSPCASGPPEIDASMSPVLCSAADNSTCGPGNWCHIGATEQSTICCTGAVLEVCDEPRVSGTGEGSLPRYYYNPLTKQCLPFIYTGAGGNQNNFLSKASCQNVCPVLENPCSAGDPATGSNGLYITCSANTPNICPAGYWCHIGADVTEAVCCPGAEDPCSLPSAAGDGDFSLTRWYFDGNLKRCAKFTYTGLNGNQNNFQTLQDCQLKCPEFQSPCATGDPAQAPSGGILFCSATRQTCPSTYWCHIGAATDTTVCCPNAGDACLSSMQPGYGAAKLPRWYFNQNTRQCLQFTYTGSGGNANNFLSEADCAAKCPVFRNPCPNILVSNHIMVTKCSAQNPHSCPSGYWCHIGGTSDTSVCCPGAGDPCRLPASQGTPSDLGPFTRWHFDFAARKCRPFQYSGMGGNENNFLTKEDCAHRCPEFVNPCFIGEPLTDEHTGMLSACHNRATRSCPDNYYCHLGANTDSTVCCPTDRDACEQALALGTGNEALPRWYFNSHARQCQEFVYSGIGGNANNFVSRAACSQRCKEFTNPCGEGQPLTAIGGEVTYCTANNPFICPSGFYCHVGATADSTVCCPNSVNPCLLSVDVGKGSASLTRWYFNQFSKQCQQFAYSGMGGNANNFVNLDGCRHTCSEFNNPCSDGGQVLHHEDGSVFHCDPSTPCPHDHYCHFGIDSVSTVCCPVMNMIPPCDQPMQVGTGEASLSRYYYSANEGKCLPFVYTGLGGNRNNFVTMNDCVNSCIILQPLLSHNNIHSYPSHPFTMSSMPVSDRSPFNTRMHRFQSTMAPKRQLCPQGEPMLTVTGYPVECNVHNPNPCPRAGFSCNVMATGEAYCCPSPSSFCLQPTVVGSCQGMEAVKFGYNPNTDSCQQFQFSGCGGNLNNFNSLSECSNICCNKGYNLLYKLSDSPSEDTHNRSEEAGGVATQRDDASLTDLFAEVMADEDGNSSSRQPRPRSDHV